MDGASEGDDGEGDLPELATKAGLNDKVVPQDYDEDDGDDGSEVTETEGTIDNQI